MIICTNVALRKESVDRNRQNYDCFKWIKASLSARRAWIEIMLSLSSPVAVGVALRKESVDRNRNMLSRIRILAVSLSARRAWIEMVLWYIHWLNLWSLSARRAWIEIFYYADKDCDWVVALRKESVDRNSGTAWVQEFPKLSLSARRAWIEILLYH